MGCFEPLTRSVERFVVDLVSDLVAQRGGDRLRCKFSVVWQRQASVVLVLLLVGCVRACYLEGYLGQDDREEGYATAISPNICSHGVCGDQ
jgi:hypothetical protein